MYIYALETWQDQKICTHALDAAVDAWGGFGEHAQETGSHRCVARGDANTEAAAGKNAGERKNWICVSDCKTGLSNTPKYLFGPIRSVLVAQSYNSY